MDVVFVAVVFLSFGLSFAFALGGIGSAMVLVPSLSWLGIPFNLARPTGLFVNTVSMSGATWSNIKHKRLDVRLGLPIIVSSIILAPLGAWVGHGIPTRLLVMIFIGFLCFSGTMMLFFNGSKYADQYRKDRPFFGPFLVGVAAGFISGLLGIGGGVVVSPLMILQGFNPKKVAAITAFSVPFSSLSAFFAYAAMGSVSLKLLAFAGSAAWGGGYLGTRVMQKNIKPRTVKNALGCVLFLIAGKLYWTWM